MKKAEGKALAKGSRVRVRGVAEVLAEIEKLSPDAMQRMREKLSEKMEEVLKGGPELEERLFARSLYLPKRSIFQKRSPGLVPFCSI